jgi:hypothetical protein
VMTLALGRFCVALHLSYKLDDLAGQNTASVRCAGINGTGPAKTLMAMDLPTPTPTPRTRTLFLFSSAVVCHPWCHAFEAF